MADDPRPAPPTAALESARAPRATGPGPDAESLRVAYLELLKLALCDLAGSGTTSVWKHTDGTVMSRELAGDDLRVRSAGLDWPLHGVTMVGLDRLDDLQACVESLVRDGIPGDLIEAGTWRGGASILARATLDTLGDARTVWLADSFQGFPAPDEDHPDVEDLSAIDYLAVSEADVRANFARLGLEHGLRFVPGFFEQTMPTLTGGSWSLVRLDGDSYAATMVTLEALYPGLAEGGYVIVDDFGALAECRQAVEEFRARHGIDDPIETTGWTGARWRRSSAGPVSADGPLAPSDRAAARAVERRPAPHVPTMQERAVQRDYRHLERWKDALERDVAELNRRAGAAEAQVAALRGAPWRGPRAWLADRLRRR
jgi:O-methyltransferase